MRKATARVKCGNESEEGKKSGVTVRMGTARVKYGNESEEGKKSGVTVEKSKAGSKGKRSPGDLNYNSGLPSPRDHYASEVVDQLPNQPNLHL